MDAAANRKPDAECAMQAMREAGFMLYDIRSSSLAQQTADATTAGMKIAEHAGDFDFIGQHSMATDSLKIKGSMHAGVCLDRFIRLP